MNADSNMYAGGMSLSTMWAQLIKPAESARSIGLIRQRGEDSPDTALRQRIGHTEFQRQDQSRGESHHKSASFRKMLAIRGYKCLPRGGYAEIQPEGV